MYDAHPVMELAQLARSDLRFRAQSWLDIQQRAAADRTDAAEEFSESSAAVTDGASDAEGVRGRPLIVCHIVS